MQEVQLPAALRSRESRSRAGWLLLRIAIAGIIAAHGWARLVAGGVVPFGSFLEAQGLPGGFYWAASITGIEIAGSLLLLLGRWVSPLALIFMVIYATGIVMVHAREGWFVVGLGRNGSEFSALLIVCLLALALRHVRTRGES